MEKHSSPQDSIERGPSSEADIIVDDSSKGGTADLLRKELVVKADHVLFHSGNQGKGALLRTGINAAKGDAVVIQDGALEFSHRDISSF